MTKQNWSAVLVALVAAFIGVGAGVCVALWFKVPDHTVDVFAFVESAVGIGFTVAALVITLGILRQRADFENMLLTRRDEMEAAIQNRIENGTVNALRNQYVTEFNQLKIEWSRWCTALAGIRSRLDTLASITAENILIPGGPQERCHHIIEEAYVALGLIEPQVDKLRAELEYQHTRLDELREAALAEIIQDPE